MSTAALSITPEDEGIGEFLKRLLGGERPTHGDSTTSRSNWIERSPSAKPTGRTGGPVCKPSTSGRRRKSLARTTAGAWFESPAKTRDVMKEFLARATERKIDRLSDLITESFRYLLRKQTMVERIHIDPATFAITLLQRSRACTFQGAAFGRREADLRDLGALGAGPGVGSSAAGDHRYADGPARRAHRRHLVERYFPHASHQVLILSTDTEVDRHYYQALSRTSRGPITSTTTSRLRATQGEEGLFLGGGRGASGPSWPGRWERGMSIKQVRLSDPGQGAIDPAQDADGASRTGTCSVAGRFVCRSAKPRRRRRWSLGG